MLKQIKPIPPLRHCVERLKVFANSLPGKRTFRYGSRRRLQIRASFQRKNRFTHCKIGFAVYSIRQSEIIQREFTMNSKERVLAAFHHQVSDRVPINYLANPGIDLKLKQHFHLAPDDQEGLAEVLQVDFRNLEAPYCGPVLHPVDPAKGIITDLWGDRMRWVEHESGGYWDFCEFPLQDATEEMVAEWPMPSPDDFDYSNIAEACRRYRGFAVSAGNPGMADVINSNGRIRGMEQTLIDLVTDDPAGALLTRRRTQIQLEVLRRTLEAAKGGIDFLWIGEDLGTQIAPMVSLETYRTQLKPIHESYIALAKSFDIPVMVHSCGSSSWVFPEWIEMGVSVVDTLQPEAAAMEPRYLKETFGNDLAFHGCISTAGALTFGTPDEVRRVCRETLEIMTPGGGYCFAPTHMIQDNTPLENVLTMYRTAQEFRM